MESYGIGIFELDGMSVVTHNRNIVNPFSDKFAKQYLLKYIGLMTDHQYCLRLKIIMRLASKSIIFWSR